MGKRRSCGEPSAQSARPALEGTKKLRSSFMTEKSIQPLDAVPLNHLLPTGDLGAHMGAKAFR